MARIMIVEDEPSLVWVFQELLGGEGYEVIVAENGLKALGLLKQGPAPDLIVSDLVMPGMGGRELLGTMRSTPGLKDIPAILVTGAVLDDDVLDGEHVEVIYKPFDIDDVLRKVKSALAEGAKGTGSPPTTHQAESRQ